jgi:hypothetical protein
MRFDPLFTNPWLPQPTVRYAADCRVCLIMPPPPDPNEIVHQASVRIHPISGIVGARVGWGECHEPQRSVMTGGVRTLAATRPMASDKDKLQACFRSGGYESEMR